MAKIVLDAITKVFDNDVIAVNDVSLDIGDGEFMVLVGPSGCGKSTILRILAGLEDVTSGEIVIGDRQVTDLQPKDRDVAMVFQNYALYPHMTVEQNLGFGLKLRKTPKDEAHRRVEDVARILGLDPLMARKPAQLSGGQRQRVAMGRAMVREPLAFLMDEPLSNLDAKLRVQMRAQLALLHERLATTTVYVTHDQVEAMTLGQRVAVLKDGILQQVDTPQNLYNHPANLFVAAFIGSPPMNLVEADVAEGTASFAGYTLPLPADAGLEDYRGRHVILGIRPSDMEDTEVWHNEKLPTIEVTAEVTEELGSEVNVIFPIDAPPVLTEDTIAASSDEGERDLPSSSRRRLACVSARASTPVPSAAREMRSACRSTPPGSTTSTPTRGGRWAPGPRRRWARPPDPQRLPRASKSSGRLGCEASLGVAVTSQPADDPGQQGDPGHHAGEIQPLARGVIVAADRSQAVEGGRARGRRGVRVRRAARGRVAHLEPQLRRHVLRQRDQVGAALLLLHRPVPAASEQLQGHLGHHGLRADPFDLGLGGLQRAELGRAQIHLQLAPLGHDVRARPPRATPTFTVTPGQRPFSACSAMILCAASSSALRPLSGSTPACAARPWITTV